jgi:hypothetical protein
MKIGDVVDEIARVGRVIEREESLKSWAKGYICFLMVYIALYKIHLRY